MLPLNQCQWIIKKPDEDVYYASTRRRDANILKRIISSIDKVTHVDLRGRAIIGILLYSEIPPTETARMRIKDCTLNDKSRIYI